MLMTFRKEALLSVLFALCFAFVACDSGGSDGASSPEWTGQWQVDSFENSYWDLSESELQVYRDSSGADTQCVNRAGYEVTDRDDNIVSFLGSTPNVENETIELRFEPSGETMIATVLDASDGEAIGDDIPLSKIDNIPVDPDNCDID